MTFSTTSKRVQIRAGGKTWREKAERIYEYLRREMRDAEVQRKRLFPKTWQTQVQRTIPLIWRMARELSTLYLRPPERDFDGATPEEVKAIERVYKLLRANRRLRTTQEHLSALQNATLWVWLTKDGVRLITPPIHDQWVFAGSVVGQDVEDVREWRIRFPVVTTPDATTAETAIALITPERAVWESGPEGWAGTGIWEADGSNPFGEIPVVYLRGCDPAPGEFLVPVPEDSLDAQRAVNQDYTDQGTIARLQGFAQAVAKGLTQAQASEIETGPESVVGIPDVAGSFSYETPENNLASYREGTDAFVKLVIACSGMSPATVMKSTGITALAKIVENIDREVERQRAKDEFEPGEQRLYDLIQKATSIRAGGLPVLPEGVTVTVTHREPVQPADPSNDAQAKSLRVQLAIDCAASIIAEEKAISIDAAQEIALRNYKLTRELGAKPIQDAGAEASPTKTADGNATAPAKAPAAATAQPAADVAKTALNGAQITSLKDIVGSVTLGQLEVESAVALILLSFPDFEPSAVRTMVEKAASFTPRAPADGPPATVAA